jgi:predicted CopG family antitoxin
MKTIMISDESYMKLVAIKGSKSFTELISEIVDAVKSKRNANIMKFAGILSKKEAEEAKRIARDIRRMAGAAR